jgi:CHRD domain
MRKIALTSLALAAGALVAGASALGAPSSSPKTFTVHMTGPQEVPKGSPTGTGTFRYQLLPSTKQVCYSLTWSNIGGTALSSHIHKGARGKSGPVVIPLSSIAPVKHSGCVKAAKSLIQAIGAHPSRYYVNVHTAKYPGGAIRGQL